MTRNELKRLCREKISNPLAEGMVSLIIPGSARGSTKRFLGVRGEIVCEYDKSCLCAFDAMKLLKAIEKKELPNDQS